MFLSLFSVSVLWTMVSRTRVMAQRTITTTTVSAHVDDNNLPPRIGKRNDGSNKTKREEEETVTDSVVIHTTIKQIAGRGGGRW